MGMGGSTRKCLDVLPIRAYFHWCTHFHQCSNKCDRNARQANGKLQNSFQYLPFQFRALFTQAIEPFQV